MRTGSAESVGKTSRMPPRTLNSPGDLDDLDPRHARDPSARRSAPRPGRCRPRRRPATSAASASGFGTGCNIAWNGATTNRGGSGPPSRLSTRSRRPKTSSSAVSSRGQLLPGREDLGHDARRTSPRRRGSRPRRRRARARSPASWVHAAPARRRRAAAAEPQAPSIVALRPFLSAARTSGNPDDRWIWRVRSLRVTSGGLGWRAARERPASSRIPPPCFLRHGWSRHDLPLATYHLPLGGIVGNGPRSDHGEGATRLRAASSVATPGRQHVRGLGPGRDRPGVRRGRAHGAVHGVDQVVEVAGELEAGDGPGRPGPGDDRAIGEAGQRNHRAGPPGTPFESLSPGGFEYRDLPDREHAGRGGSGPLSTTGRRGSRRSPDRRSPRRGSRPRRRHRPGPGTARHRPRPPRSGRARRRLSAGDRLASVDQSADPSGEHVGRGGLGNDEIDQAGPALELRIADIRADAKEQPGVRPRRPGAPRLDPLGVAGS